MSHDPATVSHPSSPTTAAVGVLMLVETTALAVAAWLHLAGHVEGRAAIFDPHDAGIAEALIAAVLAVGAFELLRRGRAARTIGIVTNGFAIAGFLVGLSITARAGHAPDIAFHVVVLPLLVVSVIALARDSSH